MTAGAGFSRVYYSILEDPKFETIYEDDHHLATWLRLLIVADQMWPSYPPIPASVRYSSLRALTEVGLVDQMPKHCYRIHGLDALRNARRTHASTAAAGRWASGEHGSGNAQSQSEQSPSDASRTRAETETETETETDIPPPPTSGGRRETGDALRQVGDNPRALGSSPRQNGVSPRQEREGQKRAPTALGSILASLKADPE